MPPSSPKASAWRPALLQEEMRAGRITSLAERGVDADSGRHRLTFFSEHRRFRVVVDETGAIIQRSAVDFGNSLLPKSVRKPADETSDGGGLSLKGDSSGLSLKDRSRRGNRRLPADGFLAGNPDAAVAVQMLAVERPAVE